jgi:hypothetical protein
LGRGTWNYWNEYLIGEGHWSDTYETWPRYSVSTYRSKRKILDGPYVDLTTIGCRQAEEFVFSLSPTGFGINAPNGAAETATFFLDKNGALYGTGTHSRGQLGDYNAAWTEKVGSNYYNYIFSETPVRLFAGKIFRALQKTNTVFGVARDSASGNVSIQSALCTDGYIYSWGAGIPMYGNTYYPPPHKLNLDSVKYFDRGGYIGTLISAAGGYFDYSELIAVTNDGAIYLGKFYLLSEPTWTLLGNINSII